MSQAEFDKRFEALTGKMPLAWQCRLFAEHFQTGDLREAIDLPTGLGKTMVMAIWLIAREVNPRLPRRLIYVVDRRTVVDQATDLAIKLRDNYGKDKLEISTLRGQLADNRQWSRDPSKPAIMIGTVDLIGSALLFSGYRSSYKRRPLEAGLLGQDSLLVLDEAHLSKPFAKLISSISSFQSGQRTPMNVIRMSATTSDNGMKSFKLEDSDRSDPTIEERFTAKKTLSIVSAENVVDAIANAADALAANRQGSRFVIFVRTPKLVDDVHKALVKKNKAYENKIAMLTGTMRGLERDELVMPPIDETQHERRVMQRFLQPDNDPIQGECFLISTSAGEVGFDLNGDHMICDASPIDSMIQRLGRVNRRGKGNASIQLFVAPQKPRKDGKQVKLEGIELSIANTIKLLNDVTDVSPMNIAQLRQTSWNEIPEEEQKKDKPKSLYELACSPDPTMVDLTDILLDNWSMTSITAPMPSRPDVAPWIRGIAAELPQTTIAWRAELELFLDNPTPENALQAIFAKHPIRPHEAVMTYSYRVAEFLKIVTTAKKGLFTRSELRTMRVALRMKGGQVVMRTIGALIDEPGLLNAEPTLILPHTLGGLSATGMLDAASIAKPHADDDPPLPSFDVADEPGYEQREGASTRWRVLIRRDGSDRWSVEALPGGVPIPSDLQVADSYERSAKLIGILAGKDLRVCLVQPIEFDSEDRPTLSLVLLSPIVSLGKPENQSLSDHVDTVEAEATRIANALGLAGEDPTRMALLFAAKWHDEGKKADIWQKYANGRMSTGEPKGKSSKYRDPQSLKHTRHEFDSLLRIHHPDRHATSDCHLPIDEAVRDLALHMIATHHGSSRPHFTQAVYADFYDHQRDEIATESIRRFARLQRTYGYWQLAWLENLLRCADAMASADVDVDDAQIDGGHQ